MSSLSGDGVNIGEQSPIAMVASFCSWLIEHHANVATEVAPILARLMEPVRLAVVGGTSSGKSTIVNALLGVPISPTGTLETTKFLHIFQTGDLESAQIRLRDGSGRRIKLDDEGQLPRQLEKLEDTERFVVTLPQSPILQSLTLIDTPGTSSGRAGVSAVTEQAIFVKDSIGALSDADAIIYVLKGLTEDFAALNSFSEITRGLTGSVSNIIGVVNAWNFAEADQDQALSTAARIAAGMIAQENIRRVLSQIVPLSAILAQVGTCGTLSHDDLDDLRELMEDPRFDSDLNDAEGFKLKRSGSPAARRRLIELLGRDGIREVARLLRAGMVDPDPGAVSERLVEVSGIEVLRRVVFDQFLPRADIVKADQALFRLHRLSFTTDEPDGEVVRAGIEKLMADPALHVIRELHALSVCLQGDLSVPPFVIDELYQLTAKKTARGRLGLGPDSTGQEVLQRRTQAMERALGLAVSNRTGAELRQIANILVRSYGLLGGVGV